MREIKLNNNSKLHSRNIFQKMFAHLKASSLGALVFRRVQGKFVCLASNF
jgi:hypothetical protein